MQRWIVIAVLGAILAGFGGGFALWTVYQNRPKQVWVPLPLNAELTEEKREAIVKELNKKLLDGPYLAELVRDIDLKGKLHLASDAEAEADARKRLFVRIGKIETGGQKLPSLDVGFNCQRKTFNAYGEAASELMKKGVRKILGIKEPDESTF